MADEDERAIIVHFFQQKLVRFLRVVTVLVLAIGALWLLTPGLAR